MGPILEFREITASPRRQQATMAGLGKIRAALMAEKMRRMQNREGKRKGAEGRHLPRFRARSFVGLECQTAACTDLWRYLARGCGTSAPAGIVEREKPVSWSRHRQ